MRNYRKAKPGEVKCADCTHGKKPDAARGWHQCHYFVSGINCGHAIGVSKNGTCNRAARRTEKENP